MSWPMPPTGQWSSGINMTDNMGSYTPEQWALMQQQNWQQWAQWQQQYSHWHNQYGDKYVQQMQAYQGVGVVPPPPTNPAPPPAPPPPDKPPPPPPHENDQPLYGKTVKNVPLMSLPSVKPPQNNSQAGYSNSADTVKNQTWSYTADSQSEKQSVNTEALKKLAEEERLFDIQFKKWEDEIQKWKAENVNHPDKQAYNEYEQKFEACRAQLMERRNQMKQKRALLTGNQSQVTNTNTGNQQAVPLFQNTKCSQNVQPNTTQKDTSANYSNAIGLPRPPPQVQFNMHQHPNYNRTNNKTIDVQDGNDSYQNMEENYKSNQQTVNSDFLRTNQLKGIPGLDLVPDSGSLPNKKQEVVEIIEEDQTMQQQQMPQAPDYLNISRGINNILGDEKIMNILSQMSNQIPGNNDQQKTNSHNKQDVQQWGRNNSNYYNNNNYNNQQNMPYKQQNVTNYSNTHEQITNSNYSNPHNNYPQNRGYRQNNIPQEQYYDEQSPYGNKIPPRPKMIPQPLMQNMAKQPLIPNPNSPNSTTMEPQNTMYSQSQSGFQNRPHMENPVIQPVKPKWIDEPLFTPSIIVDYEHKPLRLKARDFIEPVHMFDYHHKSKDGEDNCKKNFEREVDELFMRKSRRKDIDEDWNADRHYERRPLRDDARDHSKFVSREGNDFYNRRGYDRYENRRRDDRDRFGRDDRDRDDDRRVSDYDRLRDRDYGRDREFLPLRDRDPLPVRDRDTGRDRDSGRDRDLGRDRDIGRDRDSGRDRDIGRDRDSGKDRDFDRGRDKEPGYNFGRDRIGARERDSRDKERYRDRREDIRNHSRSRERDSRKRAHSKDTDSMDSFNSKKSKEIKEVISTSQPSKPQHVVMIDDLLEPPGRDMRPEKIIIILRGAPGSGKSYLAKLIRDKEAEYNGTVRIMSIDDYFMQESEVEEKDPTTGKIVKKQSLKYEYDESLEETYMNSLRRALKRTITDGYFTFLIFDAINDQLKGYADVWNFARQNGFQVYICTMEMDAQTCFKRNIHNRKLEDIEVTISRFFPTPLHHIQLDATTLLQSASITDVQMEDIDDVTMEDAESTEVESSFTSKWEKMDDAAQLARLDGTSKPLRSSQLSMEDYLQLDEWTPNKAKPGKKTVRWADIEERREQEKMRAIGFVVGQTDWNRMTDPTMGSSALTQTKYIERVRKYQIQ